MKWEGGFPIGDRKKEEREKGRRVRRVGLIDVVDECGRDGFWAFEPLELDWNKLFYEGDDDGPPPSSPTARHRLLRLPPLFRLAPPPPISTQRTNFSNTGKN
ncbi:hypothetical protein L484_022492 [Morus notabilis]|uniref:Uncharacterized protein n=1 Tax=Morus notabilis TaxID=981085 RepID=W9R025_9ROSA|nr:hypothetical protein L484_022492 [Morus notabilis]